MLNIQEPVFELGLKAYCYGQSARDLAKVADGLCERLGVTIVLTPQAVDIESIAKATTHLKVFAQHLDGIAPGVGIASVLPEAVRAVGGHGALLNHSEKRVCISELSAAINRARQVGLSTMVCADSPQEAAAIAELGPNAILAEPPELIGTGKSVAGEMQDFVSDSLTRIKAINPEITVICSAGIRTPDDVRRVMSMGVGGTGSTSGVLKANDPAKMLEDMVLAMKEAWDAQRAK